MARPPKNGFDNFPLDTQFNDQVQALSMLHGAAGGWWLIKAWQRCYQNGKAILDLRGAFELTMASSASISVEQQKEIVQSAMKVGLIAQQEPGLFVMNGVIKRIEWMTNTRSGSAERMRKLRGKIVTRNVFLEGQNKPSESALEGSKEAQSAPPNESGTADGTSNPDQKEDVTRNKPVVTQLFAEVTPEIKRKTSKRQGTFAVPEYLADMWPDYIQVRNKKRAANTLTALTGIVEELEKLAPNNPDKQRAIFKNMIVRGWVGVFLPNDQKQQQPQQTTLNLPVLP